MSPRRSETASDAHGRRSTRRSVATVLLELQNRYTRAVDRELRLLGSGDTERAEALDEAEVDPAFDAVLDALQEQADRTAAAADRAERLSDGGIGLTVLISLVGTALV